MDNFLPRLSCELRQLILRVIANRDRWYMLYGVAEYAISNAKNAIAEHNADQAAHPLIYYKPILDTKSDALLAAHNAYEEHILSIIAAEEALSNAAKKSGYLSYSDIIRTAAYNRDAFSIHKLYDQNVIAESAQIISDAMDFEDHIINNVVA
jgi:hypothetical protein